MLRQKYLLIFEMGSSNKVSNCRQSVLILISHAYPLFNNVINITHVHKNNTLTTYITNNF